MNSANAFLIPAPDDAHFGHSFKSYSFQRNFNAENADLLKYINKGFCFSCIGLTIIGYSISSYNAFSMRNKTCSGGERKQSRKSWTELNRSSEKSPSPKRSPQILPRQPLSARQSAIVFRLNKLDLWYHVNVDI